MATKPVPKAQLRVWTPLLVMIFRGESVSGHPGARGGPKRPEVFPIFLENLLKFWIFFGAFRAPGWPETDSPRKIITKSGVETRIRALGTRFVAIFRFRQICDVDYNLSSKITRPGGVDAGFIVRCDVL